MAEFLLKAKFMVWSADGYPVFEWDISWYWQRFLPTSRYFRPQVVRFLSYLVAISYARDPLYYRYFIAIPSKSITCYIPRSVGTHPAFCIRG
mgnify:CR=1 FL=1|jgi:hypothetical protein